jgi:hypothetical protein
MAQTKKPGPKTGGNEKSSGSGGGKGTGGGADVGDQRRNASLRGERPSPSDRERGETSRADRT